MQKIKKSVCFGLVSGASFALMMTLIIAFDSSKTGPIAIPQYTARFILEVDAAFSGIFTLVSLFIQMSGIGKSDWY